MKSIIFIILTGSIGGSAFANSMTHKLKCSFTTEYGHYSYTLIADVNANGVTTNASGTSGYSGYGQMIWDGQGYVWSGEPYAYYKSTLPYVSISPQKEITFNVENAMASETVTLTYPDNGETAPGYYGSLEITQWKGSHPSAPDGEDTDHAEGSCSL